MDQAMQLRQLAGRTREALLTRFQPETGPGPRLLAITSGKGGVGKTNLTVNLGLALCQRGRRVLLMDADLGLGNVDLLLGLKAPFDLSHVVRGERRLADIVYPGPGGLSVISAGSGLADLASLSPGRIQSFLAELGEVAAQADYLLLDTGAGISPQVLAVLGLAPEVLLITTPEPTALADAYAILKALDARNPAAVVRLVINRVADHDDGERARTTLETLVRHYLRIKVSLLGYVPADPWVERAVRRQRPYLELAPAGEASAATRHLVEYLEAGTGGQTLGTPGFFRRFLRQITRTIT